MPSFSIVVFAWPKYPCASSIVNFAVVRKSHRSRIRENSDFLQDSEVSRRRLRTVAAGPG